MLRKLLYPFFLIAYAPFYTCYKNSVCKQSKTLILIVSSFVTVLGQSSFIYFLFLTVTKNVYISFLLMIAYLFLYCYLVYHKRNYRTFFSEFIKKRYKLRWLNHIICLMFPLMFIIDCMFIGWMN